ncbi:3-oxoacyl-[acyl-carrier-protein] synthase III C-terminal domain-containing protein [Nodosilinea sp. PGN35]|uniref:3-oxoacyl-[acyl-carrier-protein] synthase III C-terminal domain-containing protein n=1 Tax=Nodosilinea sp. PGN35 TaxID=3020489 RepID=UPI0023B2CD0C|nr:3-oxoacyl-[acyl-carrier-protein] synthase III C-terminal domain-containing protein [Nodosilinea sp. TSF1-S3]MDF0365092.1 3-oxoacyl-[acyl-carrier-protein] synthase III C-terminal domain-containing protein [Nodosilinea sp. TSF1-S3]
MSQTYITHLGKFLPGEPIDNDQMEAYLGLINGKPSRVKRRILASNGIRQRHYALDQQQQTTHLNHQMAAAAVRHALDNGDLDPAAVDLLCAATTWPDLLVPGFASMVHGELPEFAPLEATSHQGVCCAGVAALKYAATQVSQGQKRCAVAVASELASRLFKHTQFEAQPDIRAGKAVPFDTEFLRWMLSDGAGAMVLRNRPRAEGLSLRLDWIELVSHANAHPMCMYAGAEHAQGTQSWMDYPSVADAAAAGATHLRQNIRLLDQVVQLGVEGWLRLIEAGRIRPADIDWLLCHYSSHFFRSQIVELLEKANAMIPEERWFTNLYTRGNTGCASIYLMLEELFHSGKLQPGQTIFCFVPESGRFTTAYLKLTVVDGTVPLQPVSAAHPAAAMFESQGGALGPRPGTGLSPEDRELGVTDASAPPAGVDVHAELLRQLTLTWLEFERQLQSVPLIRQLNRGEFTLDSYRALLRNLRPQVVEGARWIARAASNMENFQVRSHFIGHAQAEHRDFQMLEHNYVAVGGSLADIVNAEQNLGSEALSAFIFHRASQLNPVDLIGSMFIVEGLGSRLARRWAEQIQQQLGLTRDQVSFLAYHSENDDSHTDKLNAIFQAEWITAEMAARIVKTAQVTARLYRLQLEEIVTD